MGTRYWPGAPNSYPQSETAKAETMLAASRVAVPVRIRPTVLALKVESQRGGGCKSWR